jgi:hypothetical protein
MRCGVTMPDPTPYDLYMLAARAYCLGKFPYGYPPDQVEDRERHIAYDTRSTAEEGWLRAVVDAVLAAVRLSADNALADEQEERDMADGLRRDVETERDVLAARIEAMKVTAGIVTEPLRDGWRSGPAPSAAELYEALEPLLYPERCPHPAIDGTVCAVCQTEPEIGPS